MMHLEDTVLIVDHVSRRYGALTAVDDVSFEVRPGDVLGYLGPNGSGKSTMVKMLVGLMPPTRGRILWNGTDIQDDLVSYKALVGYVPEEAHVYGYLTATEYLRLVGRLRGLAGIRLDERIEEFLRIFNLDGDVHAPLDEFSKGMRQKVLVSAALLHNPRIFVLDEPVSGLDVTTALVLRSLVHALAADGRLIVYSSHELDTIEKVSTRVVILSHGRLRANDSAEHLRTLLQLPTLENVFQQLTAHDDPAQVAARLMSVIQA